MGVFVLTRYVMLEDTPGFFIVTASYMASEKAADVITADARRAR